MAEVYKVPSGAIDDVNMLFTTVQEYDPGTLIVFHDGGLLGPGDVTETDPTIGTFTLSFAPASGPNGPDFLMVRYLSGEIQAPSPSVIYGVLESPPEIMGLIK